MSSESKSEREDQMILGGIVDGILANFLCDSAKRIIQKYHDTYTDIFDDSISEVTPKCPKLTNIHLDNFLHEPPVQNLMRNYIEHPENYIDYSKKNLFSESLLKEFTTFFDEKYFSREEAKEIIASFLLILDDNIQKKPDLRDKLILYYTKSTNQELKKHIDEIQIHLKSFLTFDEFSIRYFESTNLLNHTYQFVGQNDILSQLDNFLESDKEIAFLLGRGGIGKSRILIEFGNNFESKHSEWELRYVSENPLTRDSIRELPERKCVIVVDDAHRREDLIILLETAQQAHILKKSPVKVILSFRPHGLDYIISSCNKCGFDRKIGEIKEVQELKRKEKEDLGKSILGKKHYQYLNALIQVAKDSTIVLVIGAKLIAEDKVQPALLYQEKEFQDAVFGRFQEDILKGVIDDLDTTLCKKILSIISILSPIRRDKELTQKVSEYLKVPKYELNGALDILERCRVLHRVGSKLRITPDVLSDHILHKSCVTLDGNSNEYSLEIFDNFGDIYFENILNNLSELDWRVTRQKGETDLFVEIWENLEEKFKMSSNLDRAVLLEKLGKVAYFQPQRTLGLIEYAITKPLKTSERDCSPFYEFTHEDVLGKIPSLLKNISYNFEYFPQSCELLSDLAKREFEIKHVGAGSNHPLTVLIDLAKYDIYKPFEYSSLILTFVEREIRIHEDQKYTCSLLDILDPILEKEILSNKLIGFEVKFIPCSIPYENTKEVRKKAIWLIGDQLKSESTKVVLRALKSLSEALNPPTGYFGRKVSTDEIKRWLPEQMEILKIIEDVSKITTDPIVKIQIKSSLSWHTRQTNQSEVADKASSIIESLPEDFDTEFMRAIWYNYERDYENFEENREKVLQEIKGVAREFLDRCNNEGKQIFDSLNGTIVKFEISEITIHPADFLVVLSTTDHKIACEVCNHIISDTSKPLAKYLEFLLSGIREKDKITAIKLTGIAVDSSNPVLCCSIAEGYAYRGWAFKLRHEEIKIITQLLGSVEAATRNLAIESLGQFPKTLINEALELALGVEIGDNEKLADTYCSIFDQHGISLEDLETEQLKLILNKISKIKVLDGNLYHLNIFLTYCSTKIPEELVDFLLERVNLSKNIKSSSDARFQPLPYNGFSDDGLKGIKLSPNYKEILRKVRDKALNKDLKNSFWLPELYSYISDNFSSASLEVLSEWVSTRDEEKINAVGYFVKEAPSDFVFLHAYFVSDLLTNAQAINSDCYKEVRSNLLNSVYNGGRAGIVGQPSPQDERIRDKAQEFMEMYPVRSPTWNFYKWLSEEAKKSIKGWVEKDEEMMEDC